jgi:hypothetical protein
MIPTAVFTPVSATLPASRKAVLIGSPPPDEDSCCALGRCDGALRLGGGVDDAVLRAAALPPVVRFARWLVAVARAFVLGLAPEADVFLRADVPPLERLSLRRPGRERGRLPRTPGSSLSSAATEGKVAVAAASRSAVARNPCAQPRSWVNVGAPTKRHGQKRLGAGEWGLAALAACFVNFGA